MSVCERVSMCVSERESLCVSEFVSERECVYVCVYGCLWWHLRRWWVEYQS